MKNIPFPLCSLMLAAASLGNLFRSDSLFLYRTLGGLALFLGILWLLRIVCHPKLFCQEMKNPVSASICGTFSMGVMVLSGYFVPLAGRAALWIWLAGLLLHMALIIWFTVQFMTPPTSSQVYASYFIVYVGIAAAAIPASSLGLARAGAFICFAAMIFFFPLLALVSFRYIKKGEPDDDARKPLFAIYCAPASLCLTGYLSCVSEPSAALVILFLFLSLGLYFMALFRMIAYLRLTWSFSFAAFTFPFIISASAVRKSLTFFEEPAAPLRLLSVFSHIQTAIACCLFLFVLIRFFIHILRSLFSAAS